MCIKKFAGAVILSALVLFGCGDDDDDNSGSAPTYTVTVNGGGVGAFGGGSYSPGATVTIFAGTAPANHVFDNWTTTSVGVFFEDASSRTTVFTMPSNAVTVTANFVSDDPNDPSGSCTVNGTCTNNVLESECSGDFEIGATCQAGGDDNNNDNGGDIGSHGHLLVGDWTPEYASDNINAPWFRSLKSNGEFCESGFRRVDDFWIGGELCYDGTWSADGQYLNIVHDYDYVERVRYVLSGNSVTFCYYEEYYDEEFCEVHTRGGVRPTGTVRFGDPTLQGTNWRMETSYVDSNFDIVELVTYLEIDIIWIYASLYFNDYNDQLWYTSGNTLYMLAVDEVAGTCRTFIDPWDGDEYEEDCLLTVVETVEFTYTHVPGVSLRLRNTSRGIDDLWEYQSWDKRLNKTASDNRQSPFRNSQSRWTSSER